MTKIERSAEEIVDKQIKERGLVISFSTREKAIKTIEMFLTKSCGTEPSDYLVNTIFRVIMKDAYEEVI